MAAHSVARSAAELLREICDGDSSSESSGRRVSVLADESGMLTQMSVVVILALTVLIGFLGNIGTAVYEKIELQNAADAAAHSSALWMARSMNAVTAAHHLMGELTAMSVIHEALGGPELDAYPNGWNWKQTSLNSQIKGMKNVAPMRLIYPWQKPLQFLAEADKTITGKTITKVTEDKNENAAGATIFDARMQLKRELASVLRKKATANLGYLFPAPFVGPVPVGIIATAAATVAHIYFTARVGLIYKEWIILDLLRKFAAASPVVRIKRLIRDQLVPTIGHFADEVAGFDSRGRRLPVKILSGKPITGALVRKTLGELSSRYGLELSVYPVPAKLQLPVAPEPKPSGTGVGWGQDRLPDVGDPESDRQMSKFRSEMSRSNGNKDERLGKINKANQQMVDEFEMIDKAYPPPGNDSAQAAPRLDGEILRLRQTRGALIYGGTGDRDSKYRHGIKNTYLANDPSASRALAAENDLAPYQDPAVLEGEIRELRRERAAIPDSRIASLQRAITRDKEQIAQLDQQIPNATGKRRADLIKLRKRYVQLNEGRTIWLKESKDMRSWIDAELNRKQPQLAQARRNSTPATPGRNPSKTNIDRLTQMNPEGEKLTQWVRATYPHVDAFRAPLLGLFDHKISNILELGYGLPISKAAQFYEKWSNRYTLLHSWEYRSGMRWRKGAAPNLSWSDSGKPLRMYIMKGPYANGGRSTGNGDTDGYQTRKGRQKWTYRDDKAKELAEELFTVVGFAYRKPRDEFFLPGIFKSPHDDGRCTFAQAIIYNANEQQPSSGGAHQPNVGWDTLNWQPAVKAPEFGSAASKSRPGWPWEIFKTASASDQVRVKLNWQTKLVPVTGRRLSMSTSESLLIPKFNGHFRKLIRKAAKPEKDVLRSH